MKVFVLTGRWVTAESFEHKSELPVPFYGRIEWERLAKKPARGYKGFNRLPACLRVVINILDELQDEIEKILSVSKRPAVLAAARLERERDELCRKAFDDPRKVAPADGFTLTHNGVNFLVASYLGLRFYTALGIDHVCSSGTDLLGLAWKLLREKEADLAILVTINSMATPIRTGYHANLGVVSKKGRIRPFCQERDGTIFADGLAVAIVGSEELISKSKLQPIGEILGYGAVADAYHMFSIDESGAGFFKAVEKALLSSGLKPDEIEFVKAHATGTVLNDIAESRAYVKLFGEGVSVTALKPLFGHTVTASGLIESLYTLKCLKDGFIPPTLNHSVLDERCARIDVIKENRKCEKGVFVSVSAGFGGFYSSIAMAGGRKMG